MQKKKKKNKNKKYNLQNNKKKRLVHKIILKNYYFNKNIRWRENQKWFYFNRNTSLTRIKNICILTSRSRSIYRFFKISRIQLRKLASLGYLPGIAKYNW